MPKSLKQLATHCSISSPSASSALNVDSSTPGFAGQHISILVPPSPCFSTPNCMDARPPAQTTTSGQFIRAIKYTVLQTIVYV